MSPDVSIIIPVFNAAPYIDRCLKSLIEQKCSCTYEIVVVNDGSSDDSLSILYKWKERYDYIQIASQENAGPSAARNLGISCAQGEYILFVDIDDWVGPYYIENLYSVVSNAESQGIVVSGILTSQNGKINILRNIDNHIYMPSEFGKMMNEQQICYNGYSVSKLYSKKIVEKHHIRFDTNIRYSEDMLFYLEYLLYTNWVAFVNKYDYYYEIHNESSLLLSYNSFESEVKGFTKFIDLLKQIKDRFNLTLNDLSISIGWSGHFVARAITTISKPGKYFVVGTAKRIMLIRNSLGHVNLSLQVKNRNHLELKEQVIILLLYHKQYRLLDMFICSYYSLRYSKYINYVVSMKMKIK